MFKSLGHLPYLVKMAENSLSVSIPHLMCETNDKQVLANHYQGHFNYKDSEI